MVMETKYRRSSYFTDQDDPQSSSENRPDSPLSGDDSRATATTAPSPKKSRRSIQKKVVHVPIGDGDGSRSKGDSYPPSDSWAWRKYGQKPIKGSPYPRGYYRCSSSKGCPARKQLERNRLDPTMLIITYTCEHNHPLPTPKHHHNHHPSTTATAAADAVTTTTTPSIDNSSPTSPTTSDADNGGEPTSPAEQMMNPNPFADTTQLEYVGDSLMIGNLGVDYSWISTISDLSSFNVTTPSSSSLVGAACDDVEMSAFPMREEDESLFGDLGELPECSVVFRRSQQGSIERCTTGAPICGSTGREFFMLG